MEESEVKEALATASTAGNDAPAPVVSAALPAASLLAAQACPTCGTAPAANSGTTTPPAWVYAIGRIERASPRFPWKRSSRRLSGETRPQGLPTAKPYIPHSPSPRTVTWCGSSAG